MTQLDAETTNRAELLKQWRHALVYAIHSLPPDAPVSIIQDMIEPPSALHHRKRAVQLLKTGRRQKSQKTRQKA